MILTVTLNPALDLTYAVDRVELGRVHRVRDVAARAGGKGLNVARLLRARGAAVHATGLLGGHTGAQLARLLTEEGVAHSFVTVAGESRRTVVVTDGTDATGFWEPGPAVTDEEWRAFLDVFRAFVRDAAVVVLSGSLPPGLADDAYAALVAIAATSGARCVLDTDGSALRAGCAAGPTVVKPNAAELTAATGLHVEDAAQALAAARSLRGDTPTVVVASLGPDGLVAATPTGDWRAYLPEPLTGNATGAGDACVAVLAAGLANGATVAWPGLIADAVAWSAAAVHAPTAGVVDPHRADRLRQSVVVEGAD
jgi:tagatose 6-phosphate kinase